MNYLIVAKSAYTEIHYVFICLRINVTNKKKQR